MVYNNPIIKGFYPDPSVCKANGKYYLVCSSFHFFPGVPLFESEDLLNWKQIGNCLTRESQISLREVGSSGGVFAPTIRYYNGRFYMVTTNNTTGQNFYVWTDDIYSEWSEPFYVEQNGIDPSLLFDDDGRVYFTGTGIDDYGVDGIIQSEIDINTGKKLSKSKCIWLGSGGRYVEGPHLYKLNGKYFLLAAEGGTEYGHMVTCAVADSPSGPFVGCPHNPVLTNRNLGGYEVQGVGHGDIVEDDNGNWWMVHLGFRQLGKWMPFHQLGRETFLTPVEFDENGWLRAGDNGIVTAAFETDRFPEGTVQEDKKLYTFENTDFDIEWLRIRIPDEANYSLSAKRVVLRGTDVTLDDRDTPTFIGLRQRDFCAQLRCHVSSDAEESGICVMMDEMHHYEVAIRRVDDSYKAQMILTIGDAKCVKSECALSGKDAVLIVESENEYYTFCVEENGVKTVLGKAQSRYLSSEVACGFTGVVIGLYAVKGEAEFTGFAFEYK